MKADQVLDPVFLCDKGYYDQLADKVSTESTNRYVSAYILGPDMVKYGLIKEISKNLECEMKIIENPNIPGNFKQKIGIEVMRTPSVEEWLYYIKNCEFYVGDSFHGLCFAIIFNKQFLIAVNSNVDGLQRFTTLLKMVGLEDRLFFTDKDDVRDIDKKKHHPIDYSIVNRIIKNYAKDSYEWLFNAIKSEKKYEANAYDILLMRLEQKISKLEERAVIHTGT